MNFDDLCKIYVKELINLTKQNTAHGKNSWEELKSRLIEHVSFTFQASLTNVTQKNQSEVLDGWATGLSVLIASVRKTFHLTQKAHLNQ